ncbi:MAG: polyhydroxyalkanoic acid synthase [Vitreoscilla sp.]|nr:polyhydroxyalkanoic acid synthase [Vitreoscilla sp.]
MCATPASGRDAANPDDANARARQAAEKLDGQLHAAAAKLTGGLSPLAMALAWTDWALHLATQPAQATRLAATAQQGALRWWGATLGQSPTPAGDSRFAAPEWQARPWASLAHAQRATEAWWQDATALRGMSKHHQEMAGFYAKQTLEAMSPANAGPLNPEVAARTREQGGANLARGWAQALDDWRQQHGLAPLQPLTGTAYTPGVNVAVTPGRVVHRNHLVELIQYAPQTTTVQAEPIFIVPSWIMKYYILDLSPENSLVRWLVGQGHTVFILSWRNPDESDALLGMADYLEQGIFDALAAIARLVPGQAVHACGYCLGGTLLGIGAAALARPGQVANAKQLPVLASVSLLAAEVDFKEPGEMGVLIDEEQVAQLEDLMAERGFLSGGQMGGSFAFLHSRDLVWAQRQRSLWMGDPNQPNDLMAWNADATRMPAVMHSEYLRRCYLHNEIAESRFPVEGRPVSIGDIRQPMFVVGTEKDHVSPWPSVYKIHQLTAAEITFALTSGGHNAGIVSEPGHPRRHYALQTRAANGPWVSPEAWRRSAPRVEGSWWTAWHAWLLAHGEGRKFKAVPLTGGLCDAPGTYVHVCYRD